MNRTLRKKVQVAETKTPKKAAKKAAKRVSTGEWTVKAFQDAGYAKCALKSCGRQVVNIAGHNADHKAGNIDDKGKRTAKGKVAKAAKAKAKAAAKPKKAIKKAKAVKKATKKAAPAASEATPAQG